MVAMNAVWPTDGADGAVASEARWRKMARLWAPSGVVPGVGTSLAPSLSAGTITVAAGAAYVDGHYTEIATSTDFTSTTTGLVVVRFQPATNSAELLYLDGVTTPTQTDLTWELPIAAMVGGALVDRRVFSGPSPGWRAARTDAANQDIAANEIVGRLVPTVLYDVGNLTGPVAHRITIPPFPAGITRAEFEFGFAGVWISNSSGVRWAGIHDATNNVFVVATRAPAAQQSDHQVSRPYRVQADWQFRAVVFHTSTTTPLSHRGNQNADSLRLPVFWAEWKAWLPNP